jgi:hypothetical protein
VTLRPNQGPARLLSTLWDAQGMGQGSLTLIPGHARERLLTEGYIVAASTDDVGGQYTLTEEGRKVAKTLEMSQ